MVSQTNLQNRWKVTVKKSINLLVVKVEYIISIFCLLKKPIKFDLIITCMNIYVCI